MLSGRFLAPMTGITLETRDLSRRFGDLAAVDHLTFGVRKGEIYGFLGPNGAGKTTTIRMIAGLLRPTSGTVHVEGREVSARDPEARRLIGLCPQENVIYPELTARENLEYAAALFDVPRAKRRARADDVLSALGLEEKAKARASALSGGMKRRLTIGMAIVHDPQVVVLDEPEAGLDPQTRLGVRDFIRSMRQERTVVLTSHNMDEVERVADRVGIIDKGKLVVEGTPSELKSKLGSGDTIEIALAQGTPERIAEAVRASIAGEVHVAERTITVRGLDLARQFPAILDKVSRAGATIEDVRYRGNTLEDVFISLTGRGLRE